MSAQTMWEVFAPIEEKYHEQVIQETWGHLAPEKSKTYSGRIVFAIGCLGSDDLNPTTLLFDFKGLEMSPWLYDYLNEFLSDLCHRHGRQVEVGGVYEFKGSFRNYHFKGKLNLLQLYREAGSEESG